jgi:hypothetical protein
MSKLDHFRTASSHDGAVVDFPTRGTRGKKDGFAIISLKGAAAVAKATNSPSFMVKVALAYMAWKTKSQTFVLSNDLLGRLGVSRENKRQALASLERDGVIQVRRRGCCAPTVTMLIDMN